MTSLDTTAAGGVAAVAARIGHLLNQIPDSADSEEFFDAPLLADPNRLRETLSAVLPARVIVAGTVDRWLVCVEHPAPEGGWKVADLSGQPHTTRCWPRWAREEISLADEGPGNTFSEIDPCPVNDRARGSLRYRWWAMVFTLGRDRGSCIVEVCPGDSRSVRPLLGQEFHEPR